MRKGGREEGRKEGWNDGVLRMVYCFAKTMNGEEDENGKGGR
jgi:hypothetical protein